MNDDLVYLFRFNISERPAIGVFGYVRILRIIMWSFSVFVFLLCMVPSMYGSAIPMWEYLSRGEKMNHLFNLFVQQVEKHCATRPEPDCSKLLLVYGLTNLAKMEDESLDDMDPYQRGANEIVWDSMMKGSSKHSHVHDYTTKSVTSNALQTTTPISTMVTKSKDEDDLAISDPGSLEAASNVNIEATEPQSFLLGPMVVRVLPNGMPIPGEKNHLPKDEDIEEFEPSKFRRLIEHSPSSARRMSFTEDNINRSQDYYQQKVTPEEFSLQNIKRRWVVLTEIKTNKKILKILPIGRKDLRAYCEQGDGLMLLNLKENDVTQGFIRRSLILSRGRDQIRETRKVYPPEVRQHFPEDKHAECV